jgi:hypothetical protein
VGNGVEVDGGLLGKYITKRWMPGYSHAKENTLAREEAGRSWTGSSTRRTGKR